MPSSPGLSHSTEEMAWGGAVSTKQTASSASAVPAPCWADREGKQPGLQAPVSVLLPLGDFSLVSLGF